MKNHLVLKSPTPTSAQTFFSSKWIFIGLVAVFEIGSIVCAAAPTSDAFIIGRVIAGIGGTGIMSGGTIILQNLVPLRKLPMYQGFMGAAFGLASVLGPTVGGVFTSKLTWRWCFWINLPIGCVAIVVLCFALPSSPPPVRDWNGSSTRWEKIAKFDPLGTLFLVPGLICLIIGLQWGGVTYPWNDGYVIALLVLGSVFLVCFVLAQCWVKENGTVPPRIFKQRTIFACCLVLLGVGGFLIIATFFLPIWFQAIKGLSAVDAGVRLLPYFLGGVVSVIVSGALVSAVGYYKPFIIVGSAISVIGFGLWTTFDVNSNAGAWIGFQILVGLGLGGCLQLPIVAAQATLDKKDIPIGVTLLAFCNFFSGTLFVAVCQTVLTNTLSSRLSQRLPGFDASAIANTGATKIRDLVAPDKVPMVLDVYNLALVRIFYVALALASLAFLSSFLIEWRSVKKIEKEVE